MAASKSEQKVVGFVPAATFLGFPDGVTGTWYHAGKQESAPKEYIDLLRAKGLVSEAAPAIDDESEGK